MQKLFLFLLVLLLSFSCSKKDENTLIIKEKDLELQMIDSYKKGVEALDKGDGITAANKFNEAELLFPQSEWAPKSALMAAYSYYYIDMYEDAINEIELYLKKYPKDKRVGYANFLLAMCYYQSIVDEKKDLEPLLKARDKFLHVVENYPNTDFALDAKFKLDLIKEILASKEMYLGNYYIQKKKWISAINRYKNVIIEYETTIYVEEALHRLVEIHYRIGLTDESKRYASMLGYNYKSSEWYKKSYKVFNRSYRDPAKSIDKKKGNFITRKFKSLFD